MNALSRFLTVVSAIAAVGLTTVSAHAVVMTFNDLAAFQAAVSDVFIEDFEGPPWAPGNQILPQPVVHNGLEWRSNNYFLVTTEVSNSPVLSVSSFDDFNANNDLVDLLTVTLPANVSAVGIFVSSLGQNHGIDINIYDIANAGKDVNDPTRTALLSHQSSPTALNEFEFLGVVAFSNIRLVEFVSTSGPPEDDFALDDFHYGTWDFGANATSTSVAEPASLALFGVGLALFGFAARRNRKT